MEGTIRKLVEDRNVNGGALKPVIGQVQLISEINGVAYPLPIEPTSGALEVLLTAEVAAVRGNVVSRWVNSFIPGNVQIVLTNAPSGDQPGIYYNLLENDIVMVTQVYMELITASDSVLFDLGRTSAVNGTGAYTPLTPARFLHTGAVAASWQGITFSVVPSLPILYSEGARSVTMRVTCNDAACVITAGWRGFIVKL